MQNKREICITLLIAVACWAVAFPLVWQVAVASRSEAGLLRFFAAIGGLTVFSSLVIAGLRRRSIAVAFYCSCIVSVALAILVPVIFVLFLLFGWTYGGVKFVD